MNETWVTVEGDSISRKAELTRLEQVRPSSANTRPKGHLHTAFGPGAKTHMWEQSIFSQGLSVPTWSNGWMICKRRRSVPTSEKLQRQRCEDDPHLGRRVRSYILTPVQFIHLHTKRLSWSFQKNPTAFTGGFMCGHDHASLGISPVEHVIEHHQGEGICSLSDLQNLETKRRRDMHDCLLMF